MIRTYASCPEWYLCKLQATVVVMQLLCVMPEGGDWRAWLSVFRKGYLPAQRVPGSTYSGQPVRATWKHPL